MMLPDPLLARFLHVLTLGDWDTAKSTIADIEESGLWREAALKAGRMEKPHPNICEGFHNMWTERGHRIRAHIADDGILLDALHVLLPRYQLQALTLYRGESVARWRCQGYGSAWTIREEVARMFAGGLNAVEPDGGVLLVGNVPKEAIIAGPSKHSLYLGEHEYVVDVRRLVNADIIPLGTFPPIPGNR